VAAKGLLKMVLSVSIKCIARCLQLYMITSEITCNTAVVIPLNMIIDFIKLSSFTCKL